MDTLDRSLVVKHVSQQFQIGNVHSSASKFFKFEVKRSKVYTRQFVT